MTIIDRHLNRLGLPPNRWSFPPPEAADPDGFVASGGDLAPETLITAYCSGLFPMPLGRRRRVGWWSPDPRGILPLDNLRVSRSLRRSMRRFEVRFDTAFVEVMSNCADPRRPHGWITAEFIDAYDELHRLGAAHSVEVYDDRGVLVGGLYGVSIGGLFAGESMFHRATDASKVALVALVELLSGERAPGERDPGGNASGEGSGVGSLGTPGVLLDVQWLTEHLASLGATEVPRAEYLRRLAIALELPTPVFPRSH